MMDAILQMLRLREQGLNIALGSSFPDEDSLFEYSEMNFSFADESTAKNRYFQEAFKILKYKRRFKNVIVLNGNAHSINHLRFYKKMELDIPYMGFIQARGGGTEWNCQGEAGCKVHNATPYRRRLVDASEDASLVLFDDDYELFDGVFAFKTVTASPPYFKAKLDE